MLREINSLPAGNLLDIGVGNGKHLPLYQKHLVTGIDTSTAMLDLAQNYKTPNIQLQLMDGEKLSFKGESFDYVVLSHVIAVINSPDRLLMEAHRVLKPGGTLFILNHFTPDNPLRFIDMAFQHFSTALQFRSVFYMDQLTALKIFRLKKQVCFRFCYFKLLILNKP